MADDDILDLIFNPGLQGTPLPTPSVTDEKPIQIIEPTLLAQLKSLEIEGIKQAESKQYDEAIQTFTKVINLCPTYASGYNNRAQVYYLQHNLESALIDLNDAITHAQSTHDKITLSMAYTQRGYLHKQRGDDDSALLDFQHGATYGNILAKQEAVRLNPYAALCNQFMEQAMKTMSGEDVKCEKKERQ